jgi:carbonic anhydrase
VAGQDESVVEDVERIRRHPLVPKNIPIHGYVYEVETGKLLEVPGAKEAGAAK